ncbi:phospholipase A and acyltransferase 3-like [Labeo rohita]|uniref:phospholipase A and acyltransferase 3-like n=1 Tax=Labeo rohita TaxID=84645 RepID=UPI0021E1E3EE|nr:phospholipase A and acyltransferase 3-like [Labeo rohita]
MDPDREPELGDLIEISRDGYQHWAIYVGNGYVIHLVKDSDTGAKGTVKKEKLKDVVGKDKYQINNHLDKIYVPHPTEDILQKAISYVEEKFPYNMASSNCEHFVTLLRYGKPHSQQVQNAKNLLLAAVVFKILKLATLKKERE